MGTFFTTIHFFIKRRKKQHLKMKVEKSSHSKLLVDLPLSGFQLTFCILMNFPIHMNTISMGLPIVHFKGSQLELLKF